MDNRAEVSQELHNIILKYAAANDMTCDELATVIAILLLHTTNSKEELEEATEYVVDKIHYLYRVKTGLLQLKSYKSENNDA